MQKSNLLDNRERFLGRSKYLNTPYFQGCKVLRMGNVFLPAKNIIMSFLNKVITHLYQYIGSSLNDRNIFI